MSSSKLTPIYRPVVREVLGLTAPVVFAAMVMGLAFGKIDKNLWWLLFAPSALTALAIQKSGSLVGQPIAARLRTNLTNGELDVSHKSQEPINQSSQRPAAHTPADGESYKLRHEP